MTEDLFAAIYVKPPILSSHLSFQCLELIGSSIFTIWDGGVSVPLDKENGCVLLSLVLKYRL